MPFITVLIAVAGIPALVLHAQTTDLEELRAAIDEAVAASGMPNAWWTINVWDVNARLPWYEKDTGRSFIPASNTKIYTTAAALELLGPDFRYETALWGDGEISDTRLKGNLIVRGSGDPVIGGRFNGGDLTETFRMWADSLKSMGIYHIDGDVIGDDDLFDDQAFGYGWQWDDLPFWYAAEISALSFNDNCVDFELVARLENMPAILTWEPKTNYIQVENASMTVAAGADLAEEYYRDSATNSFVLSSLVPEGKTDHESLTVSNPTLYFVHVLREVLISEGISVGGSPVDVDDLSIKPSYSRGYLFSTFSPALTDIVRVINKNSQNLYAEQLLKTIALHHPVEGLPSGSARMGISRSRKVFAKAGVDTLRLQLVDGSGLARQNLVTSSMTLNLLTYMYHHSDTDIRRAFLESLPVGGVDGTLSSRMKGTAAENNVMAKTGTLGNASALSGFVTSAGGTDLVFSIMANHYTESSRRARALQDVVVEILANHQK